uniref:Uncharacterized protein n=1 Tax=Brassica oleracea var. oleracea TaxID=109376 RepID=A0A0D3A3A9_BRAOL
MRAKQLVVGPPWKKRRWHRSEFVAVVTGLELGGSMVMAKESSGGGGGEAEQEEEERWRKRDDKDTQGRRGYGKIRALLKENGEDKQTFSSSYDPADGGWSTYVTDANAFFAGRRIKPQAWRVHYDRGLCARLALYCYNLQNGTAYDFQVIIQIHEQNRLSFTKSFIPFDAVNPSDPTSPLTFETCVKHIDDQVTHVPNLWWETHICRVEGSDEADYEWNDGAVNDYYKGEMPKWLSDENQQLCYVVKQSVGKNYPISMR